MRLGVITGSGSHALGGMLAARPRTVRTAHGEVEVSEGTLGGAETVHLSRHGAGHERLSNQLNHRAHIAALAECGVEAILAVTVCGAVDAALELGALVVFDDLHFSSNRLPDGSLCSFYDRPGMSGRGHWIFEEPFSEPLRRALLDGARTTGRPVQDGGCYGHVDGPRFNSRSEIRALGALGVSAVSQTAGPETVLAGEAELPYALLGYVTDHANGVVEQPTPVEELMEQLRSSGEVLAAALAAASADLVRREAAPAPTGTVLRFA
jgi:purine nucleoside phosphorylase